MPDLEALYLRLPIAAQHALCSLQGWRIQRSRFGGEFPGIILEAERRTYWSSEQANNYRDRRLSAFIRHCDESVPFYRRRFRELGISPGEIRGLGDLGRLPILTKAEVQEHYPDLLSTAVPVSSRIVAHTSGTTGGGLRLVTTLRAIQEQWATWWRYRRWHGIQLGTWCGYFGGRSVVPIEQARPPYWRYNFPARQILFSAYHMTPRALASYVEELRRRRPPWVHGYPSLLALLSGYILETGADLGYRVRWITIGAENLLPQQVELIVRAFGVHPRQHYGMAEAVANISECELGALHVDEDFAAVEFVPNSDGLGHRVVGTNFTNPAVPLLRYDVQDIVTVAAAPCPCGRPGRTVARIDGRQEDYIILRNGARLGRLDHIFKDMTRIREAQIHQRQPGDLTVRIVRGRDYSDADARSLLREIRKRTGDDTQVVLEYVESLPRSRTGKLRFVTSDLSGGQLVSRQTPGTGDR